MTPLLPKVLIGAVRPGCLIDNRPHTKCATIMLAISQAEAHSSGQPRYSLTLTLLDA